MRISLLIISVLLSFQAMAQDTARPVLQADTVALPIQVKDTTLLKDSSGLVDSAFLDRDSIAKLDSMAKNAKVLFGIASYYSKKFHGRKTANGEIFSLNKFTCACNKVPLGTWLRVTNLRNNRSIVVKANDRLHPRMKRLVDLTPAGARSLGFIRAGLTKVKVEILGKKPPKPH